MTDSNLIQVQCTTANDDGSLEQYKLAIPEDMGCNASARLRYLCKNTDQRVFSADEVVGEPITEFEARIYEGSFFYTLMKLFLAWLYGSELDHHACAANLWYLGDALGSPTFQNAAMLLLCTQPDHYNPQHIDCVLYQAVPGDILQAIFTQAYFDVDEDYGCDLERGTIY
jgi:hypothetical protein